MLMDEPIPAIMALVEYGMAEDGKLLDDKGG
jgi:hypothetical protein